MLYLKGKLHWWLTVEKKSKYFNYINLTKRRGFALKKYAFIRSRLCNLQEPPLAIKADVINYFETNEKPKARFIYCLQTLFLQEKYRFIKRSVYN